MREPILFLPGMMCDARLFAPQIEAFSSKHTMIFSPLSGYNCFTELALNVLAQAPPIFALAGLSMGGIAAMEIMHLAPERVSRLALLDTNHLSESPWRQAVREPQIEKVISGRLDSVMREEMKPHYLLNGPRKNKILKTCMDMAEALGPHVFVSQSRALQTRRDQSDVLRKVTVPTLVLCGEHDGLCPVSRHEEMTALIPNARLSVISAAGHLPVLEQADATNLELSRWLER